MKIKSALLISCVLILFSALSIRAQSKPISITVDARDVSRKVLHAKLKIPARPGKMTLLYPKWIPGEHGPNGPITDLVGLKMSAAGKGIEWQRDAEDMFAFHLDVPSGASEVDVSLDFLLPSSSGFSSGSSSSSALLDLSWNYVLLYPKTTKASEVQFIPTLRLPEKWQFGTALPIARQTSSEVEFSPVSLETLVDSPLIAGAHFRSIDLTPKSTPGHWLHIVADSPDALEIKPEDKLRFSQLTSEAGMLFGARHYRNYHFLLTLSDHVAHFGLEHHESSDNRRREKYLIDPTERSLGGYLLPHEMVHSWNGKYRRPAGLATGNFETPMKAELLWVYEGLTDYLGMVLATRCGLWSNENFQASVALNAARLDHTMGRTWRPLSDTSVAAQLLYGAPSEGSSWRRGTDFYSEGALIWLETDVIIRQKTEGRRSLDDFCQKFFGGKDSAPKVAPYTLANVIAALNEIAPNDWDQFFKTRAYTTNSRAPLGGIEGAGWRLTYTNEVPALLKNLESARKYTDMSFSIGLKIKEDGTIIDVVPGSAADKSGLSSGVKLVAVGGRRWTPPLLRAVVKSAATNSAPIEILAENDDFFKTFLVDYHGGEKYPQIERDSAKLDLLSEILKPLAPVVKSN